MSEIDEDKLREAFYKIKEENIITRHQINVLIDELRQTIIDVKSLEDKLLEYTNAKDKLQSKKTPRTKTVKKRGRKQ